MTSEFFGKKFIKRPKEFNFFYKLFIDKTSYLLKLIGVNINTCPVLDLRNKGSSSIIGDRSFSSNPKIVSKIGDYCINYHHNNGIGTVIKHIPGHGLAKVDSHHFTPVVSKSLDYLLKNDFFPFKRKSSFLLTFLNRSCSITIFHFSLSNFSRLTFLPNSKLLFDNSDIM